MTFSEICEIDFKDTKLSGLARNCLASEGATKIGDLIDVNVKRLEKIPNLGAVKIREIIKVMNEYGIRLEGQERFDKKKGEIPWVKKLIEEAVAKERDECLMLANLAAAMYLPAKAVVEAIEAKT